MTPTLLLILDGFGISADPAYNAIAHANTPHWDAIIQAHPSILLEASGESVGIAPNEAGNSEVGHLTIGAGRILPQSSLEIQKRIEDGSFFKNPAILTAIHHCQKTQGTLHLAGILSDGNVHGHFSHCLALLELCSQQKLAKVLVHAFLDGRDTSPKKAHLYLKDLDERCKTYGYKIASISGRYYAMDRDRRWERTQKVLELITQGEANYTALDWDSALQSAYDRGETDEFVQPTLIAPKEVHTISEKEALILWNFRADRAYQLLSQFLKHTPTSPIVSFGEYPTEHRLLKIAFPSQTVEETLGEQIAKEGLKQLRIAETEKFAHVTFFFNGRRIDPFDLEDRILIESPKVSTYDLQPEMSIYPLTETLVAHLLQKKYPFIVCNIANADMVGHTGDFSAACKAIEALDTCLGKIYKTVQAIGAQAFITADHGNADCMFDVTQNMPHTAHTSSPVPFVYIGPKSYTWAYSSGTLADVAPTLLHCMQLKLPNQMEGKVLLK